MRNAFKQRAHIISRLTTSEGVLSRNRTHSTVPTKLVTHKKVTERKDTIHVGEEQLATFDHNQADTLIEKQRTSATYVLEQEKPSLQIKEHKEDTKLPLVLHAQNSDLVSADDVSPKNFSGRNSNRIMSMKQGNTDREFEFSIQKAGESIDEHPQNINIIVTQSQRVLDKMLKKGLDK